MAHGRLQATATGKWLINAIDPGAVFISSDFTRAEETADLVAREAMPGRRIIDPKLRECRDAHFETFDATDSIPARAFRKHLVLGAVQQTVALCRANLIRYILGRAGQWSVRRWQGRVIPRCSSSGLAAPSDPGEEVSVEDVAKVGHLPRALRDRY